MKLHTREWGSGRRTALLVHGIMSDARTWRRVGPALASRGYRVVGVDLRGHGGSERAAEYPHEAYAADLVETVESLGLGSEDGDGGSAVSGVDVAIGHSLGGLALRIAASTLRPGRMVYVDPAWRLARTEDGFDPALFVPLANRTTPAAVRALNPKWAPEDIEVEVATVEVWDRQTALDMSKAVNAALAAGTEVPGAGLPLTAVVPSLVVRADNSTLIRARDADVLRERGFEVRTVPGAGHSVYRDDFEGFMSALEGWI
jgi:pimeloyl-ACP methyl ester carboxylesterase